MRLGTIVLWGGDAGSFKSEVRLAEQVGCEVIGIGDSPAAWHDLVVSLTVAAYETDSAQVMPLVTAPFLRHPVVAAGAMCSLHELTGGRVGFGIGTGGSAVWTIGHKKANADEMRDYVTAVRKLCNGEAIEWEGRPVKPLRTARPVPIFISADGPKGLKNAAELADGVVISVGANHEHTDEKIGQLRTAAEAAGRNFDELEIWGLTYGSVRDSYAEAVQDVTAFLAVNAQALKPKWAMDRVPGEYRDRVRELQERYDVTEHTIPGGKNAQLLDELGLTDFLAGYGAIVGTAEDVGRKAAELEARGVSCLLCPLSGNADPEGTLRRFSSALSGSGAAV